MNSTTSFSLFTAIRFWRVTSGHYVRFRSVELGISQFLYVSYSSSRLYQCAATANLYLCSTITVEPWLILSIYPTSGRGTPSDGVQLLRKRRLLRSVGRFFLNKFRPWEWWRCIWLGSEHENHTSCLHPNFVGTCESSKSKWLVFYSSRQSYHLRAPPY